MTESEQAKALQAAFPTEPVSDALRTRVENLTPLAPVVTGYKFKFRHAFAAFAVLWIGHNVPATIERWRITNPRPSYNQTWHTATDGKRFLSTELWHKNRKLRIQRYSPVDGKLESIEIEGKYHYIFDVKRGVITLYKWEGDRAHYQKTQSLVQLLSLLFFRTRFTHRSEYSRSNFTPKYDPTTDTYSLCDQSGQILSSTSYSTPIPDALFVPNYPSGIPVFRPRSQDNYVISPLNVLAAFQREAQASFLGQRP